MSEQSAEDEVQQTNYVKEEVFTSTRWLYVVTLQGGYMQLRGGYM